MSQAEPQETDALRPAPLPRTSDPRRDYAEKAFHNFHHHSLSDSALTTGSTDSSPTTTISTVDDSSATEPSPGSSPESPPPSTFAVGMLRPRTSDESGPQFFELQKQPPPKKGRNLKNLAVNTARHPRAASTTSLPLNLPQSDKLSSIASPGFVKPPSPPKRKATNPGLTLLTPASSKAPPQEIRLAIPSTPALSRPGTLRHFQSSPSLPLFPTLATQNPLRSKHVVVPPTLETIMSPTEPPEEFIATAEEEEQNFDIPLSQEDKPEAYPNGPICVYDPHIDLYLEPTAEQARHYDVILNVASEVRNPFARYTDAISAEPDIRIDGGGGIQYAPKRAQTAPSSTSVTDGRRDGSPTTPKATPLNGSFPLDLHSQNEPEYIHVPWEHNSDIVPDLLRLVKLIDEKVQQQKRVLVHCQCGVSRSASLVVAYGLYKDPTLSVQEAYDAVKKRSKWIGPNMNLIMQLQEFRTSLTRGGLLLSNRGLSPITPSSALSEWRGPFSSQSPQHLTVSPPLSTGVARTPVDVSSGAISAGPSSAPPRFKWPTTADAPPLPSQRPRAVSAAKSTSSSTYVDPAGHLVPVLKVAEPGTTEPKLAKLVITTPPPPSFTISANGSSGSEEHDITPTSSSASAAASPYASSPSLASPRSAEFAMLPLHPSPADVDPADQFGLMSPSSTEFAASPFDRSALLAQLGMGSVREHEEAPRRASSLRSQQPSHGGSGAKQAAGTAPRAGLAPGEGPRLRTKISSPTLREQQRLQSLQARIEARLALRGTDVPPSSSVSTTTTMPTRVGGIDEALMSPRATEFTRNPFALSFGPSPPRDGAGDAVAQRVEEEKREDRESAPRSPSASEADPRSPALPGGSPITRSILDVL